MEALLSTIKDCTVCEKYLPHGANPILEVSSTSKILLISQAPGRIAHFKSLAWDDAGGKRLKQWLNVSEEEFYNTDNFAIFPMAFCYPGKATVGDLPPRPECAPLWHQQVLSKLRTTPLKILIGKYAQDYYLRDTRTLTERVKNIGSYLPNYLPLPHPSPINRFWMQKNPWFEEDTIPFLQSKIRAMLE
ncbi:uracil-DNA glycosylase family protein [Aquimarina intermedia]|uniref:Uracil-DNA glycosylase n=1 Tax=Aquimarina intermedia TaxID=350814 RepID=A0A5S5C7D2_9FLAO|nr:uracil-DNA glycosylase family protein [Aquimarina intermedia]TYP75207.1 uracil-DNA glycosylase [Aquimarina intermedia]